MEINTIENINCLEAMKKLPDNSIDLMFCDGPYALGSDIIILPNGKPEYRKAVDFMSKWEQPNGAFWEEWFKEANRILKYGGHCLMFGLDRQTMLYKYYSCMAGFTEKQSLYWFFISNFPKSSDLSKNIDKSFGLEREVVGIDKTKQRPNAEISRSKDTSHNKGLLGNGGQITSANHPLAQKYEGKKYSIAPLKQTNETIMVFQKPYKTGSCMHDVLAMENGDSEITCGALDIDGNRVQGCDVQVRNGKPHHKKKSDGNSYHKSETKNLEHWNNEKGRFPSQTFVNDEAANHLDLQSGIKKGDSRNFVNGSIKDSNFFKGVNKGKGIPTYSDTNGCSKILHKCNYELERFDIYTYCPKVGNAERNKGLEGMEKKKDGRYAQDEWSRNNMGNKPDNERDGNFNHHPTVKPIQLLRKILSYFKTPNKQILLDCFAGSGSMEIAGYEEGYDYIAYELDSEYYEIAKKRIEAAKKQLKLF